VSPAIFWKFHIAVV